MDGMPIYQTIDVNPFSGSQVDKELTTVHSAGVYPHGS